MWKWYLVCVICIMRVAGALGSPQLVCNDLEATFGIARSGAMVSHTFVAMNIGDEELKVYEVKPSCGCTVAKLEKHSLAPGESIEIPVTFSLKGRHGRQRSTVTVFSNDPDTPELRLALVGEAVAPITVTPSRLFMGQVVPGGSVTRAADIVINEENGVRIQRTLVVSKNGNEINEDDAVLWTSDIKEVVPARLYRLTVSFSGRLPVGDRDIVVRLSTDSDDVPSIDVPVSATVAGVINYTPQDIVVDEKSEDMTRYVLVTASRGSDTGAFNIKRVVTPDPEIQVQVRPVGRMGYRIQLSNLSGGLDLSGKSLVIETDVASMPTLSIPFRIIEGGSEGERRAEAHEN